VTILGKNLSDCALMDGNLSAKMTCGGKDVVVTADGKSLRLNYVSPGQINAVTPKNTGTYSLTVANGSASASAKLTTTSDNIGIFANNHLGAIVNQSGIVHWYDNPEQPGNVFSVYFTGGGPVTGTQDFGTYKLFYTQTPTVTVDGIPAEVL
jgi:uncharacterized protein (TIGR03437 family)